MLVVVHAWHKHMPSFLISPLFTPWPAHHTPRKPSPRPQINAHTTYKSLGIRKMRKYLWLMRYGRFCLYPLTAPVWTSLETGIYWTLIGPSLCHTSLWLVLAHVALQFIFTCFSVYTCLSCVFISFTLSDRSILLINVCYSHYAWLNVLGNCRNFHRRDITLHEVNLVM